MIIGRSFLVCSISQKYRAISLLAISPRLYVPCAGPLCNKVMAGEGCPAAGRNSDEIQAKPRFHADAKSAKSDKKLAEKTWPSKSYSFPRNYGIESQSTQKCKESVFNCDFTQMQKTQKPPNKLGRTWPNQKVMIFLGMTGFSRIAC